MPGKSASEAQLTRENVLARAEELFFRQGYDGVTVRELTESVGVNLAYINYHFGGKRNLYREVVRRKFSRVGRRKVEELQRAMEASNPPDLRRVIDAYVRGIVGTVASSRETASHMRLLSREFGPNAIAADIIAEEIGFPLHRMMRVLLRAVAPDATDEKLTLFISSISGQAIHFVRARPIVEHLVGHPYTEEYLEELVDHIASFSLYGIESLK